MQTLTIAICSYRRKDSLVRLITTLDRQARDDPGSWEGVDIVVTIDGSDDGSDEAAAQLEVCLPLEVVVQDHAGLSTARNTCLDHATGDLVYFLDDDLLPAPGTVWRHRCAERSDDVPIVLGPCIIPSELPGTETTRNWYLERYAELERAPRIERFDRFSIANSSAPLQVFRSVGGFDTTFVGYGLEDCELGWRLMEHGVHERYDPDAIAWHMTDIGLKATAPRARELGRNLGRLLEAHPGAAQQLLHDYYPGPAHWAVDRLPFHSPGSLYALARVSQRLAAAAPGRLRQELSTLAAVAGEAAGLSESQPVLLRGFLGRPREPASGLLWKRRPLAGSAGVSAHPL